MHMVRVITIMDDVYAELYRLKTSKGMSFSEVFRYLLHEHSNEGSSIIGLAGSVSDMDLDHKTVAAIRRGRGVLGWRSPMAD
jgi:predicted CopG family antitoxin